MSAIPADAQRALDEIRAVGGDELVCSLFVTFLGYADEQMARAVAGAARGDAAEIARVAHALKSSARQLGAIALADLCGRAEADATDRMDLEAAVAGVVAMERELATTRLWMEEAAASPIMPDHLSAGSEGDE